MLENDFKSMKTNRNILTLILLSIITFGIYPIFVMCEMTNSLNTIATRYDGKKTIHFLLALILGAITSGLFILFWCHLFTERISVELKRRSIYYKFDVTTFWLWFVLGSFVIVGPIVYTYKLLCAMNLLSFDYNNCGT